MGDIASRLDASGLACPMPVVKTRQAIDTIEPGEILEVTSTDRGSVSDLPAWAEAMGHTVKEQRQDGNSFVFLIEKG